MQHRPSLQTDSRRRWLAVLCSLGLHAAVITWAGAHLAGLRPEPASRPPGQLIQVQLLPAAGITPAPAASVAPVPTPSTPRAQRSPAAAEPPPGPGRDVTAAPAAAQAVAAPGPAPTGRAPAVMLAPPAPSAQEWAFAARYTLRNSKAYRYSWGQQVRSMMGTAVEGPDQGMVRFRVEIAPDGRLVRLDTLWSTSAVAERLARQAVQAMPALPATPTGKPLIFERTIAFTPHGWDPQPIYANDCRPQPPAFRNPFAWDGRSAAGPSAGSSGGSAGTPVAAAGPEADDEAMQECLRQLPRDSVEADAAYHQRIRDRWGSFKRAP